MCGTTVRNQDSTVDFPGAPRLQASASKTVVGYNHNLIQIRPCLRKGNTEALVASPRDVIVIRIRFTSLGVFLEFPDLTESVVVVQLLSQYFFTRIGFRERHFSRFLAVVTFSMASQLAVVDQCPKRELAFVAHKHASIESL